MRILKSVVYALTLIFIICFCLSKQFVVSMPEILIKCIHFLTWFSPVSFLADSLVLNSLASVYVYLLLQMFHWEVYNIWQVEGWKLDLVFQSYLLQLVLIDSRTICPLSIYLDFLKKNCSLDFWLFDVCLWHTGYIFTFDRRGQCTPTTILQSQRFQGVLIWAHMQVRLFSQNRFCSNSLVL